MGAAECRLCHSKRLVPHCPTAPCGWVRCMRCRAFGRPRGRMIPAYSVSPFPRDPNAPRTPDA